ncbi:MAG: hypothetical protein U0169_25500 [Polyangiaceae bacterium]
MTFAARFLVSPDLFPARNAGEPWGTASIVIGLPGGPYRIDGLSSAQHHALAERFRPVLVDDDAGSLVTRTFRYPEAEFTKFDKTGWEYTLDVDRRGPSIALAGIDFVARLSGHPPGEGALFVCVDGTAPDLRRYLGAVENSLRVAVALRAVGSRAVVLHSAALVKNGRAHLFVGHSGAGKSTLSRFGHAEGARVLSDDMNFLRVTTEGAFLERLPFTGDFHVPTASPEAFPLAGVYRLEQAAEDGLRPLGRAETLGLLASSAPFINEDPFRSGDLMDTLADVAAAVEGHALAFTRSGAFWKLLAS